MEDSPLMPEPIWIPPNGGYGWVVVMASFLSMALTAQPMSTFGLFMPDLIRYYGTNNITIAWIGSINMSFGPIMGILIGPLIQRYDCRTMTIIGGLLITCGTLMSSMVSHIVVLYIGFGAIVGVGVSCCFNSAIVSVQYYFTTKRAMAASIVTVGTSIGSFVWPPLCRFLISKYDWLGAMFIFSAIHLNMIPIGWLMRPPGGKQKNVSESESKGVFKNMFDFSLLKNKAFLMFLCAVFLIFLGHLIPFIYLPLHGEMLGYGPQHVAFLVSILGISGGTFRLLFGWLGDKQLIHRSLLYGLTAMGSGSAMICLIFAHYYYQSATIASIIGAFGAGYMSLNGPILVDILGVENLAKGSGLYMMSVGFGNLISQSAAGAILDAVSSTNVLFIGSGCCQILASVFVLLSFLQQRSRTSVITDQHVIETYTNSRLLEPA